MPVARVQYPHPASLVRVPFPLIHPLHFGEESYLCGIRRLPERRNPAGAIAGHTASGFGFAWRSVIQENDRAGPQERRTGPVYGNRRGEHCRMLRRSEQEYTA
jgi:hypothetical protein